MSVLHPARAAVDDPGQAITRRTLRVGDLAFSLAVRLCVGIALAFLVWLIVYAVSKGWDRLDLRLITEMPVGRISRIDQAGAQSAITGTLWVISTTAVLCLPVGILGAIYLEEYGNKDSWYNRLLELNIQNLAGVPSIIFGILGLGVVARQLNLGFTIITAAIILALLVLPMVIIATREAIRAVPQSIRQASYALGATKWQTVSRQVLPAAVPGIATGAILAISRAIGEAAPLVILGAVTFVVRNPDGLFSSYTTLPIQIYRWLRDAHEEVQALGWAAIVLLLIIVLLLNSVAILIRNKFQKRW